MKKTRLIAVSILFLLTFTIIEKALAQNLKPGVSAGNEFTYAVASFWSSNDLNATVPSGLLELNDTNYQVKITDVSGSDVSIQTVWSLRNGTVVNGDGTVSLETGLSSSDFWAIIGGNLNPNDRLHPHFSGDPSVVNGTVMRKYSSGERATNYLYLNFRSLDPNDPTNSSYYNENTVIYFDKQTGMLVELHDNFVYDKSNMQISIVWNITGTNVWTVSGPVPFILPTYAIVGVVVAVIVVSVVAVMVYRRRTHGVKRRRRR